MILALDTSTRNTSLALGYAASVWQTSYFGTAPVSATILEQVDSLLSLSGHVKEDITHLVLGSGPGSFTGLRVSFSLFRSLSQALSLPLITLNSLDVLAAALAKVSRHAILQRARKGFAYLGFYAGGTRQGALRYVDPEEAAQLLAAAGRPLCLSGDAACGFTTLPEDAIVVDSEGAPSAALMIDMAAPLIEKKEYTPFEKILPDYMRLSDAEEKAGMADG